MIRIITIKIYQEVQINQKVQVCFLLTYSIIRLIYSIKTFFTFCLILSLVRVFFLTCLVYIRIFKQSNKKLQDYLNLRTRFIYFERQDTLTKHLFHSSIRVSILIQSFLRWRAFFENEYVRGNEFISRRKLTIRVSQNPSFRDHVYYCNACVSWTTRVSSHWESCH